MNGPLNHAPSPARAAIDKSGKPESKRVIRRENLRCEAASVSIYFDFRDSFTNE